MLSIHAHLRRLFRPTTLVLGWLSVFAFAPAIAAPPGASEAAVKAAYVYNFVKFTDWPAEAFADDSTLVICTDAKDELSEALLSLDGKKAGTRRIVVQGLPAQGLAGCQVALIDSANNAARCEVAQPVLTITTFNQPGTVIRLFLDNNKLRFAIDLGAARRGSIKLSAKLLSVAVTVIDK